MEMCASGYQFWKRIYQGTRLIHTAILSVTQMPFSPSPYLACILFEESRLCESFIVILHSVVRHIKSSKLLEVLWFVFEASDSDSLLAISVVHIGQENKSACMEQSVT